MTTTNTRRDFLKKSVAASAMVVAGGNGKISFKRKMGRSNYLIKKIINGHASEF